MTMNIRITNETPGTNYVARVRVFNCAQSAAEDIKEKSESPAEQRDLAVGASAEFYVHSHRHVIVEEVQPAQS